MKTSVASIALGATAAAAAGFDQQSQPFTLRGLKTNEGYQPIGVCAGGAAIEILCLNSDFPEADNVFHLNTTADTKPDLGNMGPGLLTWTLKDIGGPDGNFDLDEPMSFVDADNGIKAGLFGPDTTKGEQVGFTALKQLVTFDADGKPAGTSTYACKIDYLGRSIEAISFLPWNEDGSGIPDNCEQINVVHLDQ